MNETLRALFEAGQTEGIPSEHLSFHWAHHHGETKVGVDAAGSTVALASGVDTPGTLSVGGRAMAALERLSYFPATSRLRSYPRVWRAARALAGDLHADLTFPIFKAAVAAATLLDHLESRGLAPRHGALIGDGAGFFGSLLLRLVPGLHIYFIDFPRMLFFQARTLEAAMPGAALESVVR